MPDVAAVDGFRGCVFYDANCAFCVGILARFGSIFHRRGYVFVPLQDAIQSGQFEIESAEFLREMKLLRADGKWFGEADVWIEMFNRVWYLRPFGLLSVLPGFHAMAHRLYRHIAANRHCLNGACAIEVGQAASSLFHGEPKSKPNLSETSGPQLTGKMPILPRIAAIIPVNALTLGAFALKSTLPPWIFMWVLAFAIFAGCKWATLLGALHAGVAYTWKNAGIYLFGWTGMNAITFLHPPNHKVTGNGELGIAFFKLGLGALLLWGLVPNIPNAPPLVIGWLGMIGIILMLHFGVFHVVSVVLRRWGFNAPAMMNAPLLAKTVGEFWGVRWNQPFHELTTRYLFRPVQRLVGPRTAVGACFLASGLIHDLVITIPAGAGYGLPTLYFLIQGVGLLAEKRFFDRHNKVFVHRAFTWLIVVGPVGLLFPPVFVERIILPMLTAIGAN